MTFPATRDGHGDGEARCGELSSLLELGPELGGGAGGGAVHEVEDCV